MARRSQRGARRFEQKEIPVSETTPRTDVSPEVREFLLALADDKHLMGQQHAEWIGVTPFLEEDLAFCSIGQDELGHAALLYEVLVGDDDQAIDALAFDRTGDAYRSCHLVEFSTDDWATAFARHWLFDLADQLRWELLAESTNEQVRHIAARVEREELFHRLHADQMVDVLVRDAEALDRLIGAVTRLASMVRGMFEPAAGERDAIAQGVASGSFLERWDEFVSAVEDRIGPIEWGDPPKQEHRTVRSADWQPLMTRMREVIDLDTSALW